MIPLHRLHRGDSPLIVDVPHAGTFVPPELAARLSAEALAVPDTDWHVDKLYAFAPAAPLLGHAPADRRRPQSRPVGRRALSRRRQH
jgi:N-formylglutamate amidohydrolase